MVSREVRIRAVLAPAMLCVVGFVYWLDLGGRLGVRPGALSAAVLGLLGLAGLAEYAAMMRKGGFAVARGLLLVTGGALFVSAFPFRWMKLDEELYPLVVSTVVLLYPLAVRSLGREEMKTGLELQGATLLGFCLIAWPTFFAQGTCFRHLPSLLYVVLVCKGGDIGGYCLGKLFGRHKLIPHISPGKTWEGAAGSMLASMVLAVSLRGPLLAARAESGFAAIELPFLAAVLVGGVLNFTTQTGDLVESLLKRRCGQKDSSNLLPAHGGVLDLVDSLLFSFCAWFLILIWLT